MDDLSICLFVACSVYIYGHSSEGCPGCQNEGKKMTEEQAIALTRVYREAQGT